MGVPWGVVSGIVLTGLLWAPAESSLGERLVPFKECLANCTRDTCQNASTLAAFQANQSLALRLLWSCPEECDYKCMWHTLAWLQAINYTLVPQFHGKWPFVRLWALQEPASVVFSLLNLLAFLSFRRRVSELESDTPMRRSWLNYAHLAVTAWLCSVVFHTRDTFFTECLDYFSAFAAILYGFYVSILRMYGRQSVIKLGRVLTLYFIGHVGYLGFIKFDYGYNMGANVVAGLLSTGCWLAWMYGQVRRCGRAGWDRVWEGAVMLVLATASLGLELLDFPPYYFVLDAHALWHASTAPLPLLWAKFVVKDCEYLSRGQRMKDS